MKCPFCGGVFVKEYDRDELKELEREIELTGDNKFVGWKLSMNKFNTRIEDMLFDIRSLNGRERADDLAPLLTNIVEEIRRLNQKISKNSLDKVPETE